MDLNALRSRDLNQLKVLLALLTMRSVTKAAQELDVSQLAVSKTLDRLRRELGDPLLVREGNQRRKIIS
jgi:DNA-binding transcriptional LysR family regulator